MLCKGLFLAALGMMFFTSSTQAGVVFDQTFNWVDCVPCGGSGGTISIEVAVADNYLGDPSLELWTYQVTNTSFNPDSAHGTNGLSGLTLLFPQPIPELGGQSGPAGWSQNSTGFAPPDAVGWDQPSASGIAISDAGSFSFTTVPRRVVTVPGVYPFTTSFAYSYDVTGAITGFAGTPLNLFSGDLALPGDPAPEPASWMLLGIGAAALLFRRRPTHA
jgi:hypothetical protein